MTALSDKDFVEALRDLMADRQLSFRKLAIQTGRYRSSPYSVGTITQWTRRERQPTIEGLEVIAKAAGVDPRYFREYREYLAAEEAKRMMAEVGLDRVLAKLRELDDGTPS